MKTYKEFITELNKLEKFILKKGIQAIQKFNPGQTYKSIKKSALRTTKSMRSDPDNPFVSPRREAENLLKKFQSTIPGQKGANIMKTRGGKYVDYDPTRVRQGDSVSSAPGTFSMRGQSKKSNREMDFFMKQAGKKGEDARSIIKNTGDQHRAIYNAPAFKGNPSDAKIDSVFPKNRLGAPVSYTHLRAHETGRNLLCRLRG